MAKNVGRPQGERRSSAPVPRARCESPKRRLTEEQQARGRLSCLTSYDTKTLFGALRKHSRDSPLVLTCPSKCHTGCSVNPH